MTREEDTIGGESETRGRVEEVELVDERGEVMTKKRLTSCETDFIDATTDEKAGQTNELGGGKEVGWRGERDTFLWHAVVAAEVATFGEGEAEVGVLAGV